MTGPQRLMQTVESSEGAPQLLVSVVSCIERRGCHISSIDCPSRTETNELDIGYFLSIEARICQMNILRYPEKPCVLQANHSRLITMNNIQGIVVIV